MIQHDVPHDTTVAIAGSFTTAVLWLSDFSPVVVLFSALITIAFSLHRWWAFYQDRKQTQRK